MAGEEKTGGKSPSGSVSHPWKWPTGFASKGGSKNLENSFLSLLIFFSTCCISRNVLQAVGVTSLPLGALGRYQTFFGYLWP